MKTIWLFVANLLLQSAIIDQIDSDYTDIERVTVNNILYHLYWSGKLGREVYFLDIVDLENKECQAMVLSSSKQRILKFMRQLVREEKRNKH